MVLVPPPVVLEQLGTIRDERLKDFHHAQKQLQKALVTCERFDQASDNGAIPSIVSNAMKVPALQLLKGTPDIDSTDADVMNAKNIATEACDNARAKATEYVSALYDAQVVHCKAAVDTAKCADRFSAALTDYAKAIIQSAQPDGDVHIWDACILRLRNAFAAELTNLSFDLAARLRKEAIEKESKANAVATARANAETSTAARPIEDLLKDGIRPLDKQEEQQVEVEAEGAEGQGRFKRRRRRKRRVESCEEGPEGQGQEEGDAGQRLRLAPTPVAPSHDVLSWVSPPGPAFHHHWPDTYPDPFFAAPIDVQTKFVTSKMSPLYYDTRLINRAFHNLTDVELSSEQSKLLALNPKF
ncbi:hypothetical protein DFH06DRAFT_975820, partial [Mycena polygramma]